MHSNNINILQFLFKHLSFSQSIIIVYHCYALHKYIGKVPCMVMYPETFSFSAHFYQFLDQISKEQLLLKKINSL